MLLEQMFRPFSTLQRAARKLLRHPRLPVPAVMLVAACAASAQSSASPGAELSLDGTWQSGLDHVYTRSLPVPGLATDPARPTPGTLWYKRTVHLPRGDWKHAELTLHGARFAPAVYINGQRVSASAGGMAPTVHQLAIPAIHPDANVTLEIALQSLDDLNPQDASAVPKADLWRSDNSSGLWDSVTLHLYGNARITHVVPETVWSTRTLHIRSAVEGDAARLRVHLEDSRGHTVARATGTVQDVSVPLGQAVQPWSPDHPTLYRLVIEALDQHGAVQDRRSSTWGLRDFTTRDKRFFLNGHPLQLRGGTVVWHRFLRDPHAPAIAWNTQWFQTNVHGRLKSYGANFLRFHLGLPPERLLDLCDRDGLLVQMEWPFFHGISASDASMREQWTAWLDVAMRHPSVAIVHAWNETNADQTAAAWHALNAVLAQYPPLVVAHRDTLHIHKYWWSLFENLGLYYDSADQFPTTIMVDEFGGDYLDTNGGPGDYPAVRETFLRFLGRDQTRALRLQFHAEANARVAEYWRRLGAAGFAPFCILSSPQDGDSWFLGDLLHPQPMPVWDALAAAFAPESVSLDLWDRNFLPHQHLSVPVFLFNDTDHPARLAAVVRVHSTGIAHRVSAIVPAHSQTVQQVELTMPSSEGAWQVEAVLQNTVPGVTHRIASVWDVRTLAPRVPASLQAARIGVAAEDAELRATLEHHGLTVTTLDDPRATLLVTGAATWPRLQQASTRATLEAAHNRGIPLVLLDAGPRDHGQSDHPADLGPLDGAPRLNPGEGYRESQPLFAGARVTFQQAAEPESHIQPGPADDSLWASLPRSSTWLWNGLRGGLIAPAAEMSVEGLGREGFLAEWTHRGADSTALQHGSYFAYELAGYFAFSTKPGDAATIAALRRRVAFLAEDAPALKDVLNLKARPVQTDLAQGLAQATGRAQKLIVLASCGKNLTRAAVVELQFPPGEGDVILSQLFTAGRLTPGAAQPGAYGIRFDPAAEQFVLNILARALNDASPAHSQE